MHACITKTEKNGKEYLNLDTKKLQVNDTVIFTLRFDEPMTGEGKYGTWYLYNITLEQVNDEKIGLDVSFFANGNTSEYGVKLGEWLTNKKKGDSVTLKRMLGTMKNGKPFFYWELPSEATSKTFSKVETKPEEDLVEEMINNDVFDVESAHNYLLSKEGVDEETELYDKTIKLFETVLKAK